MKSNFSKSKPVLLLHICLLVLVIGACRRGAAPDEHFTRHDLPLVKLDGKSVTIATYQYLGSWLLPDADEKLVNVGHTWRDAVRLNFDPKQRNFQVDTGLAKLNGTANTRLTPDTETGVFEKTKWENTQMSLFMFCGLSPRKQVAVLEIDTDNMLALYANGKFVRELSGKNNIESGTHLLIPVQLEIGENTFLLKTVSTDAPPRLRMALILDRSKDFQAAQNNSTIFLSKQIYNRMGVAVESPVIKWDALLNRMSIGIEVSDVLSGKVVLKRENAQNGNVIKDGGKPLAEGIYKIIYKSNSPQEETEFEYFIVGSPKGNLNVINEALDELSWSADEKLNLEAQLRRVEILFRSSNYNPGDNEWQEKVLFTLGSLAEFVKLKRENAGDIFNGFPGLQFRGFTSKIDHSKQFYRLFIPPEYKAGKKIPLLLIMPTTVSAGERPFLESPFVASHHKAVQICNFAEKYGFGILWPGFRNDPNGLWTYESVHAEEALEDVEKYYDIDCSKISLYGICSGGIFAGRLATIYPDRFAAIVFDKAIFARDTEDESGLPKSLDEWLVAINPIEKIIRNSNIKIFVLHDGSKGEGHGEFQLTKQFLETASAKGRDVKYTLGQRGIRLGLWESIFGFLAKCKNEHADNIKADVPAGSGYVGPISDVFATPFIVVEGTRANPGEASFMEAAVKNLKAQYREQFYGAEFVVRKDTEITDEDIERYSLVLVGNSQSNVIWGKLAAKYPESLIPYTPQDDWSSSSTKDVFAEVFKNPANKNNYLLLFGSNELSNMPLLRDFNPFTAWFDSYVYKYRDGHEREYKTAYRP